jgi:aryl-alcohol dehydrogenase-like predicted oxidoreductase
MNPRPELDDVETAARHPGPSREVPTASSELGRQGFGAMRLREHPVDDPDTDPFRVINAALDLGVTMIDTADAYENEELVGKAVRDRRDEVHLASKFGLVWHGETAGGFDVRADPDYVRQACEASLRRLDSDVIDLYYLHHRSDDVPIEETVGAMATLVNQGKVRLLGLSNVTADDLRRANTVHPISALQEEWSIVLRDIERELVPAARDLGTVIVAHSPNGHGILHADHQTPEPARSTLETLSRTRGVTPGQVALAWVHHRQAVHQTRVLPLPGTTRTSHLHENVAAADLSLSEDELRRLDALAEPDEPANR